MCRRKKHFFCKSLPRFSVFQKTSIFLSFSILCPTFSGSRPGNSQIRIFPEQNFCFLFRNILVGMRTAASVFSQIASPETSLHGKSIAMNSGWEINASADGETGTGWRDRSCRITHTYVRAYDCIKIFTTPWRGLNLRLFEIWKALWYGGCSHSAYVHIYTPFSWPYKKETPRFSYYLQLWQEIRRAITPGNAWQQRGFQLARVKL